MVLRVLRGLKYFFSHFICENIAFCQLYLPSAAYLLSKIYAALAVVAAASSAEALAETGFGGVGLKIRPIMMILWWLDSTHDREPPMGAGRRLSLDVVFIAEHWLKKP